MISTNRKNTRPAAGRTQLDNIKERGGKKKKRLGPWEAIRKTENVAGGVVNQKLHWAGRAPAAGRRRPHCNPTPANSVAKTWRRSSALSPGGAQGIVCVVPVNNVVLSSPGVDVCKLLPKFHPRGPAWLSGSAVQLSPWPQPAPSPQPASH